MCGAVSKPVNVLAWPKVSAAEIFDAGAQRISVGGALAFTAVAALAEAAARSGTRAASPATGGRRASSATGSPESGGAR